MQRTMLDRINWECVLESKAALQECSQKTVGSGSQHRSGDENGVWCCLLCRIALALYTAQPANVADTQSNASSFISTVHVLIKQHAFAVIQRELWQRLSSEAHLLLTSLGYTQQGPDPDCHSFLTTLSLLITCCSWTPTFLMWKRTLCVVGSSDQSSGVCSGRISKDSSPGTL